MTDTATKKSDLGVRTLSAIVMVVVAGGALWAGGWVWAALVALVALGVLWEWVRLSAAITRSALGRAAWFLGGVVYVGGASVTLQIARSLTDNRPFGIISVLLAIVPVIATDIGAYFAGRAIGGPKILPSVSPSKTWAGLGGGAVAATLALLVAPALIKFGNPFFTTDYGQGSYYIVLHPYFGPMIVAGALIAIVAQTGDFFESWMKRRAGVKDSGNLIPGHGGLFDRVDGLLAVCYVIGLIGLFSRL